MTKLNLDRKTAIRGRNALVAAFARAGAQADAAREAQSNAPPAVGRAVFTLKAGAGATRQLPKELLSTDGAKLLTAFHTHEEDLTVTVEAIGMPSMRAVRNRLAQLESATGVVCYRFWFDKTGRATLRLSNALEIRAGLAGGFVIEYQQ